MPESTLRWQSFNQKKPYFIGTLVLLVVMGFLVGLLFKKLAGVKEEQQQKLEAELAPSRSKDATFTKVYGEMKKTREELDQVSVWAHESYYWAEIMSECRAALIRAEGMERKKMGVETGVWIETGSLRAWRPPVRKRKATRGPCGAPLPRGVMWKCRS